MRYSIDPEKHNRIFGAPDPIDDTGPGRARRCKVTGQWFKPGQHPHNRPSVSKRNPDLATPQIAPAFEPFRTGVTDGAEVIGSRADKAEFMRQNDLVEFDDGVTNAPTWVEEREERQQIVETIRRFAATDTDYYEPEHKAEDMSQGCLDEGSEISVDDIEVIE